MTTNHNPSPSTLDFNPDHSYYDERREELFQRWRPIIRDVVDELHLKMPEVEWMKSLVWSAYESMALLYNAALTPPSFETLHRHIELFLHDALRASALVLHRPTIFTNLRANNNVEARQAASGRKKKK